VRLGDFIIRRGKQEAETRLAQTAAESDHSLAS
jgi:hypothetical protein